MDASQLNIPDELKDLRRERRAELIDKIRADRLFYSRRGFLLRFLWITLSLLALVLSWMASLLVAVGWLEAADILTKTIISAMPSLAALFGTILVTFRLREAWEMRELGRIEADQLAANAKFLSIYDVEFDKLIKKIHDDRIALARNQATGYFSALSRDAERIAEK